MQNDSSTSASTRHIRGDVNDDDDDDYYFDHYSSSKYYPHQGNYSITTSVTIRVTPEHYRLLNWAILWGGFVCGVALAAYQVRQEAQWLAARKRAEDLEQQRSSMATTNTSLPFRPSNYTGASHPFNPMMQHGQQQQQQPSNSSSSAAVVGGGEGDGEGTVSSADWSRSRFRRLLLVALVTRTVMIPVQLWSSLLWSQFVADTLPEMTFASAWTLLVSFIVQLVGVATGTAELRYNNNSHNHNNSSNSSSNNNNNNINGTTVHDEGFIGVVQWIAYGLYGAVLATYFWNPVASVLLYALLCCIYAGLFGTALWFAPRLLWLLYPNLQEQMALAVRLIGGSALVIFVLAGRTVGFARKVVAPPDTVSWWWQYGILELIPAILFLLMMRPKSIATTVDSSGSSRGGGRGGVGTPPNQQHYQHNRTRSSSPAASSSRGGTPPQGATRHLQQQQQQREATPLLKSGAGKSYTSTVTAAAAAGGDHQ